jgi:CRP-like cAMP-binding protein
MEEKLKRFISEKKDQLFLFSLLNEGEVEQIVPFFKIVEYKKGDVLFNENDSGDFIAFILSGFLEVKKSTEFKGRQIVIAALKEGSFVGEMSLINEKEPRSATVAAREDSEVIILHRKALDSIIENYPHIGIKILKGLNQILAVRLRKAVERIKDVF